MLNRSIYSSILFVLELIIYIAVSGVLKIEPPLVFNSSLLYFLFQFIYGHYVISSTLIWEEIQQLTKSHLCFFVALLVLVPHATGYERRMVLVFFVIIMFCSVLLLNRAMRIILRSKFARRTLIIGTGVEASRLGTIAARNRFALTNVIGYIDVTQNDILSHIPQNNVVCHEHVNIPVFPYHQMDFVIRKENVSQIIIAIPEADKKQLDIIMENIYDKVSAVKYLPNVNGTINFSSQVQDFDGMLLIATSKDKLSLFDRFIKRAVDIVVGLIGVVILLPLLIFVKLAMLKEGDKGPMIFSQERVGFKGRSVKLYKFRSMVPNAEGLLEELMEKDPLIKEEYLKNKKLVNDPRITKVGHFLRKTSLDEWPQFINVLKGEMSFVGPRPYLYREIEDMGIYYETIISCRPGITGMWQANGRSDVGFQRRCELDDYYFRNWNIWLDLTIIYKTVRGVIYGKGSM